MWLRSSQVKSSQVRVGRRGLDVGYRPYRTGGNRAEGILPRVPWRFQRHPQLSEHAAARGGRGGESWSLDLT